MKLVIASICDSTSGCGNLISLRGGIQRVVRNGRNELRGKERGLVGQASPLFLGVLGALGVSVFRPGLGESAIEVSAYKGP